MKRLLAKGQKLPPRPKTLFEDKLDAHRLWGQIPLKRIGGAMQWRPRSQSPNRACRRPPQIRPRRAP
eukprot:7301254-Lingulodinium_polyedra.AAC.1